MSQWLVLHAGSLGDCALTLSLLAALRRGSPRMRITLAARSGLARWAARHEVAHAAHSLDAMDLHQLFGDGAGASDEPAQASARVARILSLLGGPTEPMAARLNERFPARVLHVDPRPTAQTLQDRAHIVRQWISVLTEQGVAVEFEPQPAGLLEAGRRRELRGRLAERVGEKGGRLVLVHPGSGGLRKCVRLDLLEGLARSLTGPRQQAVWMIGPDEIERFGPGYMDNLRRIAPVIYEESIEAAADLACGADAYLGHDAGMTHVAALAGIPTVAIFGPTDPGVWRPLGPAVEVVGFPSSEGTTDDWIGEVLERMARIAR